MQIPTRATTAAEVAMRVARDLNLDVQDPVILRATNNVVLWLRPTMLIARVHTGNRNRMELELEVASQLALLGAPVIAPTDALPRQVHSVGGWHVSFWPYHPQVPETRRDPKEVAAALEALHFSYQALPEELSSQLPSFTEELDAVGVLLRSPGRLGALAPADRAVLVRAFDHLREQLIHVRARLLIHGSPHDLNTLEVDGEIRFIDFETSCWGPFEWDLAHQSLEVAERYRPTLDERLLDLCRQMVSAKTAAWCWKDVERGDMRFHAEHHLAEVKKIFARES